MNDTERACPVSLTDQPQISRSTKDVEKNHEKNPSCCNAAAKVGPL
jgi:hypothetical protein